MENAKRDSWNREPFTTSVQLPYRTRLRAEQFERVRLGVIPEMMEDKWFVYFERPHSYFHRSWTGLPVFRLTIEEPDGSAEAVEASWSVELASKPAADIEYQARLVDFLLYAIVLHEDRDFPLPEGMDDKPKGLFQHHISGAAYPESPPKSKKGLAYRTSNHLVVGFSPKT